MRDSYPIFLKPRNYLLAESTLPQKPEVPEKPEKPKQFKRGLLHKIFLPEDILTYDDKIYQKRLRAYPEKLASYNDQLKVYQAEINRLISETNIAIFRNKLKRDILLKTKFATKSEDSSKNLKGRSEDGFFNELKHHIPSHIFRKIEFLLPNGNGYVPDMAYVDKQSGLCIDIEIDEPYTINNREPIHYEGFDDYRNEYFNSNGWFVIRFAEEQVLSEPNECINFILKSIEIILGVKQLRVIGFSDTPKAIAQWDFNAAKILALNNHRDNYFINR